MCACKKGVKLRFDFVNIIHIYMGYVTRGSKKIKALDICFDHMHDG
jgi:hypothetical protein